MTKRKRLDNQIEYCNARFGTTLSLSAYRPGHIKLHQLWINENNGKPLHSNHEPIAVVSAYLDGYIKALEQAFPDGRKFCIHCKQPYQSCTGHKRLPHVLC